MRRNLVAARRLWNDARFLRALHANPLESLRRSKRIHLENSLLPQVPLDVVRDSRVFVDVGANQGSWTAAILDLRPHSVVFTIEPSSRAFASLLDRFGGDERVDLHRTAVTDQLGTTTLNLFVASQLNSVLLPTTQLMQIHGASADLVGSETVNTATLDHLICPWQPDRRIDILKIDVQGGELGVIAGGTLTLARTRCVLLEVAFLEHYQRESLFWDLDDQMNQRGFRLYRFGPSHRTQQGELVWTDATYLAR
jgi:FkbM family methyltransferase